MNTITAWRNSRQRLLPEFLTEEQTAGYDIYPIHSLGANKIRNGYKSLVAWMVTQQEVMIDGYTGILWHEVKEALDEVLQETGIEVQWHFTHDAFKDEDEVTQLTAPFMGEEGSVWGNRTTLTLQDFFHTGKLAGMNNEKREHVLHIVIGTGAALVNRAAPVIYLDIPKNEQQYRMRANAVTNLGYSQYTDATEMYKRAYFIDWVVLNNYKQSLLHRISIFADTQWGDSVSWIYAEDLQAAVSSITHNHFRVRPWFEPGAWGGQWMKEHITQLPKEEVNYAWSFEMIVPENGVVFESDHHLLEIPFEWLMYYSYKAVLGKHAEIFRHEFPIRFDFLDTFGGGNLSIQCHPSLSYIRQHFGETITQDETYYILDCKEDAGVYLGLQEDIDPSGFRKALEDSQQDNVPIDITRYVQLHDAHKHDLFLIPNGTVHSAGANNMVLEISATPYIFTFKMYDWLRLGLDGKPRPINIEHAFNNIDFSRKGDVVKNGLISRPSLLEEGTDWQCWHLPTHREHFYDVHRIEFDTEVSFTTGNCCLVMMLVEGTAITVKTSGGSTTYHYAETFVIPAAAEKYSIINNGEGRAKVIKAFIKEDHPVFSTIVYENTI
ncbi:class I mannose-6-phosphate isomerase [Chitinophaga tropicalis]|uniref:class I mannose-6-phosphate isomerase n=1 Tax=Chitinophaga tropicalis TaxID=2683588 RepID=UPI001E5A1934|nr:class I mannose-6-phosphate isomerase [Chitinophaga tropicalis]